VAGKCSYTDDTTKVLCERIKLLFRKIGRKAVNVDIRNVRFARVDFSHSWHTGPLRINLNPGNRIG